MTPPFDVRPATKFEMQEIQNLIINNFGNNSKIIHKDDVVFLNHIGSEDQMDEIIINGNSIGTRRYDLVSNEWIIKLNSNGLSLLNGKFSKRWVKVGSGAVDKISQGANILIPGVVQADPDIKRGDYIVVIDCNDNIIAGGIARINESERTQMERGVYAKNYRAAARQVHPITARYSWEEIIEWNQEELLKLESEAIAYIQKTKKDLQLPVLVSFSGGKDSLVTLELVRRALPDENFKVLFVDTGIEFPETVDYVLNSSKLLGFEDKLIIERVSEELFWEAFYKFGPPGRDFRYCCKFAKLAPIQKAISQTFGDSKCISFVGQRRYESFRRAISDIWQNQYVPSQINVSPIQNWTALMIWMYIKWRKLPYNKLYEEGYERIGCWVCPSTDMAQFQLLRKKYKKLYEKLKKGVKEWSRRRNLPKSYWDYGLWRFKKIPKKIANVLSLDLKFLEKTEKEIELVSLQEEHSDCETQSLSVIGSFSGGINIEEIQNFLPMLGKVQTNKNVNFILVSNKKQSIILYSDGTFRINFKKQEVLTQKYVKDTINNFVATVLRAAGCIKCELCVRSCEFNAIRIENDRIVIDDELCTQCNNCFSVCSIITVIHKDLKNKISILTAD